MAEWKSFGAVYYCLISLALSIIFSELRARAQAAARA